MVMRRARLRRTSAVATAAVALVALAACGTRLPDRDFVTPTQPPTVGARPTLSPSSSSTSSSTPTDGSSAGQGNPASAPGVTPTTITIGQIVSRTNLFDPGGFSGPGYGLEAFVRYTNAHGGLHGRQLVLKTCDDDGTGPGNQTCAHTLVASDHVFALVSNAAFDYAGASYVNAENVPDIGGQPIDNAYNTYRNLFDLYGESYPRNGQVGENGQLYAGTEIYRYFKVKFPHVPLRAGVVEYNVGASERYGASIVKGLELEGYSVDVKVVSFVLSDFDSVAIDFKHKGVQYVYDTLDGGGNVALCDALDQNGVTLTAKVLTTQSWTQTVGSQYASAPKCRSDLWVTGNTRSYEDTKYPQVAEFRQQMAADGDGGTADLSEWALEGWAGGLWFSDAAASCGANLTRACVEAYMTRGTPYTGHGLLTPRRFSDLASQPAMIRDCLNVARWNEATNSWATQVPDMDANCYLVHNFAYPAN
jgi:branched-chain amino acid transport system substrate-binding protein